MQWLFSQINRVDTIKNFPKVFPFYSIQLTSSLEKNRPAGLLEDSFDRKK